MSQLLIDQHRIAAPVGRTSIGILLFQDLLVAPTLIFLPSRPTFARARDKAHARELIQAGADFVNPEAVEAGLQFAGRALEAFGYDSESVRSRLALERDS